LLDLVAVSDVDQHVDGAANLPLSSNSGVGYGMNGMGVPSWPRGGAACRSKCGECTPVRAELLHDGKIVVQMSVHSAAASPRRRRTKRRTPLGGKREYAHTSNAWRWS
jgi:hypothetical protein